MHIRKQSACLGTASPVFIMPELWLLNTAASVKPSTLSPQAPLSSEEYMMARLKIIYLFLSEKGRAVEKGEKKITDKKPIYFKDGQLPLVE